ncbi:MAG: hypothetical protein FJ125_14235 [Deltaproteobacteria bacterium]|nr:hypothetical protein [Deltaproteobacteria bacterium]
MLQRRGSVPLGGRCREDSECSNAGYCLELFLLGDGHCTTTCARDRDCNFAGQNIWPAGADWGEFSCLDLGERLCVRTCEQRGCPAGMFCAADVDVSSDGQPVLKDLCLDTDRFACATDADCAQLCAHCILLGWDKYAEDGSASPTVCYDSGRGWAIPPGEACDPEIFPEEVAACLRDADCTRALGAGYFCDGEAGECQPQPELVCQGDGRCFWPGRCSAVCRDDEHCPDGMICGEVRFRTDDNGTPELTCDDGSGTATLCLPLGGSARPCAVDADCAGGESCHLLDRAGGVRVGQCGDDGRDEGAHAPGEACTDDPRTPQVDEGEAIPVPECSSGFCLLAGYCSAACRVDADCPAGAGSPWVCLREHTGPDGQPAGLCIPGADCTIDADCAGAGEFCEIVVDGEQLRTICSYDYQLGPGLLPAGAACDPELDPCGAEAVRRCASGRCAADGHCTALCRDDQDCPGAEWLCSGYHFLLDEGGDEDEANDLYDTAALCLHFPGSRRACARAADCAAGETCQPLFDLAGEVQTRCGTPAGGQVVAGQPCENASECASGFCAWPDDDGEQPVGLCSQICVADEDCPAGLTCRPYPVLGGPAPQSIQACLP